MDIPNGTSDRQTAFAAFTEKGIQWIVDPSCRHLIPDPLLEVLLHPAATGEGRVVRENKVRRSMLIRAPHSREAVFAKLYKKPAGTDRFKYLFFPSKASAEWKSMLSFFRHGFPVARPLARGEKRRHGFLQEAYLFTLALEGAASLSDIASAHHSFSRLKALAEDTATLAATIHREGFFFRDLHAGNLLVVPGDDARSRICLVDFHKVWQTGWVPHWMRIRDLAQLRNSLTVSRTAELRFLNSYLRHAGLPPESLRNFARRIDHTAQKMWNTHLMSRTKRCLKESSEFTISTKDNCTIYRHKVYPETLINTLLNNYEKSSQGNPLILKKTHKETVSLLRTTCGGEEYKVVVKESRFASLFSRLRNSLFRSRAKRNWIGARALSVRGVPTPDAMALTEYREGVLLHRTLLISRYVDQSHELNDYVLMRYNRRLSAAEVRHKRRFIEALAGLIRDMHEKDIYHADLKSNNILVAEEGDAWKLQVVDLDRIRVGSRLSFQERANNLAQINASVAACITPSDRLYFFKRYAQGTPLAKERKHYFRQIVAIGREKNTRPYGLIFKES